MENLYGNLVRLVHEGKWNTGEVDNWVQCLRFSIQYRPRDQGKVNENLKNHY